VKYILKDLIKHHATTINMVVIFFQLVVTLSISTYVVLEYTNNFIIKYDIKIIENTGFYRGEIYYSSNGIYSEHKKETVKYKKLLNQFQNVKICVSNQNISSLRLDPLLTAGKVVIKDFSIRYQDQVYKVDFRDIDDSTAHNVISLNRDANSVVLQCLGKDPSVVIDSNITFNRFGFTSVVHILLLTLLLFSSLKILAMAVRKYSSENIVLAMILSLYSIYVVLFSSPVLGEGLLYTLVTLSLAAALINGFYSKINYFRRIILFLTVYLLMSYLSIMLSTHLADISYLNSKVPLIICACFIPVGFYNINRFDGSMVKIFLTLLLILMALLIVSLNNNLLTINNVYLFSIQMERSDWTQKNYIFWYLLLCFGTLSFYNFRKRYDITVIVLILALSYFAIFFSYSLLARVAFFVATAVYLLLTICKFPKKVLLISIWILTIYIVFSPILFSLIDLTPYHHRLVARDAFYHTSAALIKEHWLFGYGFGSTLHIQTKDFIDISEIPKNFIDSFPGGHPHNLSLLFWLEFGILGALFLAFFIHKFLEFFIEQTYGLISQPALFGMIIAFDIITSFSWSIWYPQVLLTFAFFGVMFVLSMNNRVVINQELR
jgi:hypothetical protein